MKKYILTGDGKHVFLFWGIYAGNQKIGLKGGTFAKIFSYVYGTMNMKKNILYLAIGLAATAQAQEATNAQAVASPANGNPPAVVEAQAAPEAEQAAPAAESVSEAQPSEVQQAPVAEPVAEQAAPSDSTAEVSAEAPQAPAMEAPAEAVVAEPAAEAVPAESVPAEVAPAAVVNDSVTVAVDSSKAAVEAIPVVASEAAPAKASVLDGIIHGNAYNTVGNEAAGATIGGDMGTPHKMYGHKLVYFEPINQKAAVSFGESVTYFLGFDNTEKLGLLTAGVAFGKFGFSVDGALGKTWVYDDFADGSEQTVKTTTGGTMIGAAASMNLGALDIVLRGHYANPDDIGFTSEPNSEVETNVWDATGNLAVSYGGESVFWTLGVDFLRHDSKVKTKKGEIKVIDGKNFLEVTKTTVSDTTSRIEVTPSFNVGAAVLEAENARVYLGLNSYFPIALYDEIDNVVDKHQEVGAFLEPNIFAEIMLGKHVMAFGGASYEWDVFSMRQHELDGNTEKDVEAITGMTTVNLGARFQYDRAALEMAFTKQFLQNPFGSFSNTDEIAVTIGAFINF